MKEIVNPIVKIRKELDMTREDLSRMSGISYSGLYSIERGHALTISKKVLNALSDIGYGPEKITKDYEEYKDHLIDELKKKYSDAKQ